MFTFFKRASKVLFFVPFNIPPGVSGPPLRIRKPMKMVSTKFWYITEINNNTFDIEKLNRKFVFEVKFVKMVSRNLVECTSIFII